MAREQKIADTELFGGVGPAEDTVTLSKADLKALIAQQVAESLAGMAGGNVAGSIKEVLDQMALSMAEMSHQTNRTHKPVDPRVLSARKAGQDKLDGLLARIALQRKEVGERSYDSQRQRDDAIKAVTPRYRLISVVVLDDDLIKPTVKNAATKENEPVAIYWAKEPNDAMIPINDLAREVHAAFRESRGSRTEIERRSVKPAWTTENGLYIEGRAPKRRELALPSVVRDTYVETPISQGGEGSSKFVNVLGTAHQPFERVDRPLGARITEAV